jgi:predicted transcriptional regulator
MDYLDKLGSIMNDKQSVIEYLQQLPEDATIEQIRCEVGTILGILEGQRDIDGGRTHSHEEVMEFIDQCLAKYVGRRAPVSN